MRLELHQKDKFIRPVTTHDKDDNGYVCRYCECDECSALEAEQVYVPAPFAAEVPRAEWSIKHQ